MIAVLFDEIPQGRTSAKIVCVFIVQYFLMGDSSESFLRNTFEYNKNNFTIYTNGQKKGYTVYMSNYSIVNSKQSSFLT